MFYKAVNELICVHIVRMVGNKNSTYLTIATTQKRKIMTDLVTCVLCFNILILPLVVLLISGITQFGMCFHILIEVQLRLYTNRKLTFNQGTALESSSMTLCELNELKTSESNLDFPWNILPPSLCSVETKTNPKFPSIICHHSNIFRVLTDQYWCNRSSTLSRSPKMSHKRSFV